MSDLPKTDRFANVIPFPTVKEADILREAMSGMEVEIKERLDRLQVEVVIEMKVVEVLPVNK